MAQGMTILDLALESEMFKVKEYYGDEVIRDASNLAYFLWNNNTVTIGEDEVNVIETTDLNNYYSDDNHGDPIKVVFEALGKTWIAEGHYDSWGGDHFPNEIFEAELVNKPVWVAKAGSN